jgi:hypothetical protein
MKLPILAIWLFNKIDELTTSKSPSPKPSCVRIKGARGYNESMVEISA